MTKRNATWLVGIVLIGLVVGVLAGTVWGLVAGGSVLVVSEIVERVARHQRRAERAAANTTGTTDQQT
jgi:hypothetical protein